MKADTTRERGSHYRYRVYGLTLVSDVRFPELSALPARSAIAPVVRVLLRSERRMEEPLRWVDTSTLPDGTPWLSCARINDGYFLRFHNFADFFVDRDGSKVTLARRRAEVSLFTLRHLILDQTMPFVLNLSGRDAIHATAVVTPHGACAFIGAAGSGKSTLAASFLTAGYPVMGDDCVVLRESKAGILAVPAYPGLRLWNDAFDALAREGERRLAVAQYTTKARLLGPRALRDFPSHPQRLAGIYRLVRSPAPSPSRHDCCEEKSSNRAASPSPAKERARAGSHIEALPAHEAFFELLASAFPLDRTDHAMLRRQFTFFSRVLRAVPVKRLVLPDDFSALPEARTAVLADLGGRQSHPSDWPDVESAPLQEVAAQ